MTEQLAFLAIIFIALLVSRTPLRYPFAWMETFFHEMSHGFAAILTFGWVHRIDLKFNGAGLCTTKGGWRIPTLLAGYSGAVTFGALIYYAAWLSSESHNVVYLKVLLGVMGITTILWVRNFETLLIMLVMAGTIAVPAFFPEWLVATFTVKFCGIYVLLNAITAPLDLIDGKHVGDGADLQKATLIIPEGVWIALWFLYACFTLVYLWQLTTPAEFRIFDQWWYPPISS